jgi:Domain of unknown function (DUF4388)
MAEQSNTTDPGPQEQTQKQKQKEPWWMDHVRQNFVTCGSGQATKNAGPPSWALPTMPSAPTAQPVQEPPAETPAPEQAAPAQPDSDLPEPTLTGVTKKMPIASILEFLSVNRQSGTLYLTNLQETFSLEILEGDVVHASSDLSTQEQLLGSILVARDKIGTEQLEDFYRRFTPHASADNSADHEELVSREDLKLALEAQVQELFNRLYAADDCSFHFYEGETSGVEQRIRMNVTRLLLESARTQDELERPDPVEPDDADDTEEHNGGSDETVSTEMAEPEVTADHVNETDGVVAPVTPEGGLGILDQIDDGGDPDGPVEQEQEQEEAAEQEIEAIEEEVPFSEAESFDDASEFDDTVPFDGGVPFDAQEPLEDMPLEDTPPFDDTAPFDNHARFDDTPPFDLEEYGEFDEPEDSVDEEVDPAGRRDVV